MSTSMFENQTPHHQVVDVTLLLKRYLEKDPLESAFSWSVSRVLIPEPPQPPSLLHALHQLFKSAGQEQWAPYISQLVEYMIGQSNPHRVKALTDMLTTLVSQSVIPAKLVCESVLKQLNMKNQLTWQHGMSLVRSIVGGVDYKGCREIMKLILDRFDQLPRSIHEREVNILHSGRELMTYILDRNAALLPAYIAYDEIKLRYSNKDTHPHWALRDITATLNGSMEVVANIVSGRMLPHLFPIVGVSHSFSGSWKLDLTEYSFLLPGRLPYLESLHEPQVDYLCRVIIQPNSKDFVLSILNLSKQPQHSAFVEQCMESLLIDAMKKTNGWKYSRDIVVLMWSNLANQLLMYSLLHIVNANSMLSAIGKKVRGNSIATGRHYFMWMLQHFTSGTLNQKDPIGMKEDCQTITNLISSLYPEAESLPLPDTSSPQCVFELAPAGLWLLQKKKAQASNVPFTAEIPIALSEHVQFLQEQVDTLSQSPPTVTSWYLLTALLNAFCLSMDVSSIIINNMANTSFSPKLQKTPSPKSNGGSGDISPPNPQSAIPLSLDCIGLMVMQARGRIAERIKIMITDTVKQPQATPTSSLVNPSLLETFSRALLWCGTKAFQSQLIPAVFKLQAWSMLQSLLEIVSYRVHTQLYQTPLRFSILQLLHSIASVSIIPTQLFISAENTALHLIQGLNGFELPLNLAKGINDPKQLFHTDSDELNKVLLLVLAQSLHFSHSELGQWLENLLKALEVSPTKSLFQWPESAIPYLPLSIRQHCTFNSPSHPVTLEMRRKLINRVEEEHQNLQNKSEADLQQLYNEGDSGQYILCVIWKQLVDTGQMTPQVSRILQRLRLSPKKLTCHCRTMIDYIIYTCPKPGTPSNSKFVAVITHLNNLIWKYFFCPLDRLLLCILWRSYGGQEAILSMTLIYQLLMREDITNRVNEFVQMVPPDVWKSNDWGQKHAAYLSRHRECFQLDTSGTGTMVPSMPMYFGNVCLRLLPVIDLTLQRLLEIPETYLPLITKLLDKYKSLYKYHQYPMRFLYTLLHYYNSSLAKVHHLRKLLASSILGGLPKDNLSIYLTPPFIQFLSSSEISWSPSLSYWTDLLLRIFKGLDPFNPSCPPIGWPLNEFPSGASCLLHSTCVEVMSLPCDARSVSRSIINALVNLSNSSTASKDLMPVINGAGALFSALPESYSECMYAEILELFKSPLLVSPSNVGLPLSFSNSTQLGCMLNLLHAFLHHSSVIAISGFVSWMRNHLKPIVNNELQLLYLCHLLGPLINRVYTEKPSLITELVMELYNFIQKVDQAQDGVVQNCDVLCDLLYHIKYKHIGDLKKEEIEKVVTSLHPQLRMRLRFLVHSLNASQGNFDQHSAAITPTSLPTTSTGGIMPSTSESMDLS